MGLSLKEWLQYSLIKDLAARVKLNAFKRKWRENNQHNGTFPVNRFPINCVSVGKESYGELNVITFADRTQLHIGNYVSIAQEVRFMLDVEHHTDHISTFPFKVKILKDMKPEAYSKGDIIIDDDVWLGYGSLIMSGVHIGKGAVVAAGSVVTKNVPPYAIVGGVPAKTIKFRFDDKIIEAIKEINFDRMDKSKIVNHLPQLYTAVTQDNLSDILEIFNEKVE